MLSSKGQWLPRSDEIEKLISPLQQRSSILRLVSEHNKQLRILQGHLGPVCVAFGLEHAAAVVESLCQAEEQLCGKHSSFVKLLTEELQRRFPEESRSEVLVEGWFYWPLGAGGLFAENTILRAICLQRALQEVMLQSGQAIPPFPKRAEPKHWDEFISEFQRFDSTRDFRKHCNQTLDKTLYPFDADDCFRHWHLLQGWSEDVQRALDTMSEYPQQEAAPVVMDEPLQDLIKQFVKRTKSFTNFGGHEADGLGNYVQNLVAKYGTELQRVFGTLGLIPADLVPHALLRRIRSEKFSNEVNNEVEEPSTKRLHT